MRSFLYMRIFFRKKSHIYNRESENKKNPTDTLQKANAGRGLLSYEDYLRSISIGRVPRP